MTRTTLAGAVLAALCLPAFAQAEAAKPLKVLYVTGGGFHKYKDQTAYLLPKIQELAHVTFETKEGLDPMRDPKLGEGYDAIVYNICFASEDDKALIENAARVTREGKPTVMVHCAMHCFWKSENAWTECVGMLTRRHDKFQGFKTEKVEKNHPIMKSFPDAWETPGEELYETIRMYPNSVPLLNVKSAQTGKLNTVAWVNQYGKGRVFATTLGHDMKTMDKPDFHRLVAYGILWACDQLGEDGKPKAGYAGPGAK
jgi:type 1 glutamine amidotransferase